MRAYVEYGRGQYDKAAADLTEAIKNNKKKDEDLYLRRGHAYLALHEYKQAIADFSEAAKMLPDEALILESRAEAEQNNNQDGAALDDLSRAIRLDPSNSEYHWRRVALYAKRGEWTHALQDAEASVNLAPDDADALNALAWLLSTTPDEKVRNGQRALQAASGACEKSSWNNWEIIDTLAAAYAETGNFREAVAWEKRAIDLMKSESKSADAQDSEMEARLLLYQLGKPYREKPSEKPGKSSGAG